MPAPEVKVKIGGDNSDLAKELNKSEGLLGSFASSAKGMLAAVGAAFTAAALGEFFHGALEEASKAESGIKRLGVAVTNAGESFRNVRPEIEATVDRFVRLTTYTDDDLRSALTTMIGITGDVAGSLKNLGLVTDLAAFKQIPLEEASLAVAKAMEGNTREFNKLGFAGKDASVVLESVRAQFKGYAEGEAQTFSGALTRISNNWGEFKEAVGTAILQSGAMETVTNAVVKALVDLQGWVVKNEDVISDFTTGVINLLSFLGRLVGVAVSVGKSLYDALATPVRVVKGLLGVDLPKSAEEGFAKTQNIEADYQKSVQRMAKEHSDGLTAIYAQAERKRTENADKEAKDREKRAKDEADAKARVLSDVNYMLEKSLVTINGELQKQPIHWASIIDHVEGTRVAIAELLPLPKELTDYTDTSRKHVEEMNALLKSQEGSWMKSVDGAVAVAHGLIDGARAMGQLSDSAAQALSSIVNMVDGVKQIAGGNLAGGLVEVIGSLANILAGLGNSAAEKARQQIIRNNTDALLKNTSVLELSAPGHEIAGVKTALAAAQKAASEFKGTAFEKATVARDQFVKSLVAQGISVKDAEQLIKDLGIEGFDSKDFKTFLSALGSANTKIGEVTGGFGQDFSGQFDFVTKSKDILGLNDNQQLQQFADLAKKFSPALGRALDVDLSTPEGRQQAMKNLQGVFAQLNAGTLKPEDIGVSGGQFLQIIQTLLPLLNSATGLQGLPSFTAPSLSSSVVAGGLPAIGSAIGFAGGGVTSNTVTGDQQIGPFYITPSEGMDSEELAVTVAEKVAKVLGKTFSNQNVALGTPLVGGTV